MELKTLDRSELIEQGGRPWHALKENSRWLDFGDGNKFLSPALLKVMSRSDRSPCLHVRERRTDRRCRAEQDRSRLSDSNGVGGSGPQTLRAIRVWDARGSRDGVNRLSRTGTAIDGRPYDLLLFDLLASEYAESIAS